MQKLIDTLNCFYYEISLAELHSLNADNVYANIRYNSLRYLDVINYKERCTISELATALNVSKSAITMKVKELLKHGLVEKTQSTKDKRVFYLSISPKMAELYHAYDVALYKGSQKIKARYDRVQIGVFCEMLDIIRESFTKGV